MSQPNKQSDLSNLPFSIQQQLLFQRQARVAAAVAQNQNQNQMPIQYLPQNLAVQAQAKQMNRVATQNSVALQLMQQKQQQINAAAVAQQQQQYITKQNFLAKQNQIQNLQAQQIIQQQKMQQQRQENMAISIINELNKVTAELQQPNIPEIQKQALFNRKKSLEEFIAKIRIMKQQQQNQKDKQPQLQINPTNVNQAQLIEQLKQQRLQQLQMQQLQKQQQQQFQKQQLSNLYQQSLASTSKPNVISQQSLAQLTPQQQVQILSNMTNSQMINQTLLKQQQIRLQKQRQMQKLGLFQTGQIDLQQQQTHPGILGANSISSISLPTSVTSTSVIPTSTLATAATNLQSTNLQATSKLSIQLAQPKVEPKTGTPTISTSTIKSVSTEALSKANITVNMSQINNLNSSSTPNFSPKTTIENSSKQEKVKTPTISTKNSTSTSNSVSNLNNLSNKSVTGTTTPLNSVVATTAAKVMSPIQKQPEIKTQQKQLSPISKVKKEIVTTPSNSINKESVNKDAINNSYLAKSTVNVVSSPSLSAKINTPKTNISKSFSPLNKAATAAAIVSPVINLKTIKSSPQISSKIPANMPAKTTIDNKKTPHIVQSPALQNGSVASPVVGTTNQKIINNTTIPINQSIPLGNSVDITKNVVTNNIKKETTNVNGKISSNKSFSPIAKPHVNGNISSQDNKNENITTPNKYFSPKMNPIRSNSTSSINNLSPSHADKLQTLVNGNININQNKTLPFSNNNNANINNANINNANINNALYTNNKNPMLMNNNGLKVLESLKQHGAFTNIILPKSPFQSTKVFTEISSTNSITGPPLKISGKLLEKRKREEKFHDMVFNSNVSTKKRNIKQLVNEITPNEKLSGYTEQLLFDIADDFIDQMTVFASKMAKHRNSTKIEAKDVQISLERIWNMKLPGVDIQKLSMKKSNISNVFQQKVNYVRKDMRDRNLLKEMHLQEEQRKQKEMEKIEKEKQAVSENGTPNETPNI